MTRISDILTNVRDTLSDPDGDRWTDTQLLRLVNSGQREIVLHAKLLRAKYNYPILANIGTIKVPSDCFRIIRVLVNGNKVPILTHEQMDDRQDKGIISIDENGGWEAVTGTEVEYIIFDKLNTGYLKLYPIPEAQIEFELSAATQDPEDELYDTRDGGLVGATGYDFDSNYGVVVDASDDYDNIFIDSTSGEESVYGVCVLFEDDAQDITVYYLKRPETITSVDDDLEIDLMYDTALQHYVAGMALRNDKDTQNRQMGEEELVYFSNDLNLAIKDSSLDFNLTRTQYEVPYSNGF